MTESTGIAVVVGAGPGLGAALARAFAADGMAVALARRDGSALAPLVEELRAAHGPGRAYAYDCDATDEAAVDGLFRRVADDLGVPDVTVYNAGAFVRESILDTEAAEFERCWRVGCLGGFLVGRAAARALTARIEGGGPGGTILFTGATASLRGGARFHNLAVPKFGLRALAQSMARELGPSGIHVAHVVIDGQIRNEARGERYSEATRGADALLHPEAIAEAYLALHRQHRSAWSQEIDLRPFVEKF